MALAAGEYKGGLYALTMGANGVVAGFGVTDDSATNYLNKVLGQEFYNKRSKAIQDSLANPKKFLEDRQTAMQAGVAKAGKEYRKAFEAYAEAGFDEDSCKANALQHAKNAWHNQRNLVDLLHPEQLEDKLMKANTDNAIGVADLWGFTGVSKAPQHPRATRKAAKGKDKK